MLAALALSSACAPLQQAPPASAPSAATPATSAPSKQPDTKGLRLVFSDEFDGDRLDESKWQSQLAWGRTNQDELQFYAPDSAEVKDGLLTLTARKQSAEDKSYTSGAISSFDRFDFTYGYVEMRGKAADGQGLWPAFWLLSIIPNDPNEIDIMEVKGQTPDRTQMSLHWGIGSKYKHTTVFGGPDFSADFHTFGCDWRPDAIVWYVDGVERFRVTDHIPSMKMYIIANLAIGGRYPGLPDASTQLPSSYQIDYIRVYARD